jgi:hypothetical protein
MIIDRQNFTEDRIRDVLNLRAPLMRREREFLEKEIEPYLKNPAAKYMLTDTELLRGVLNYWHADAKSFLDNAESDKKKSKRNRAFIFLVSGHMIEVFSALGTQQRDPVIAIPLLGCIFCIGIFCFNWGLILLFESL